jgi:hypothetical protein
MSIPISIKLGEGERKGMKLRGGGRGMREEEGEGIREEEGEGMRRD